MNNKDRNYLPVQKCIAGEEIKNLSDTELLAIIIGTGVKNSDVMSVSSGIIKSLNGLSGISDSGLREISKERGIGLKKAIKIQSAFELGRRVITDKKECAIISSPEAVWKLLLPEMARLEKEEFRLLILNNKNMLLKKSVVSIGTISESIVHPREVFRDAIREGGASIIVAHNHPSGILTPSKEDISTTKRLVETGKLIGISLLDHVIITDCSYLSLKDEGYM